jgi:hypothetical protein
VSVRDGDWKPVVIIGAPRSGTNALRDALCRHPDLSTWPCDEINYVWRHGNRAWPTDDFGPDLATPGVARYVRRAFARQARAGGTPWVVEKTCANAVRVAFVHRILPEARFVHILRDGRDVVPSAMERWRASFDVAYLARKARFVPLTDVPYYATRFLLDRMHRRLSGTRRARAWGPRITVVRDTLVAEGLAAACAVQWRECVTRALDALAELPPTAVHSVRYEELTTEPATVLARVAAFVGADRPAGGWEALASGIRPPPAGKASGGGLSRLAASDRSIVDRHLAVTLARLGYGTGA